MRAYEQAGGVVPFEWKGGSPSHHYGAMLLEVWTLSFGNMHTSDVSVNARIVAATWDSAAVTWRRMQADGAGVYEKIPNGPNQRIRRHAMLSRQSTTVRLTVGDWP